MIKNIKWLVLVSLTLIACNDDETVTVYDSADGLPLTAGTADFSNYVALGDSFAAGFSDGALFIEGQKGAYPNILAQQFALVGGGTFTTPFMADNTGGFIGGNPSFGPRTYVSGFTPSGIPIILPALGTPSTNPTTILTGPFNNMGVPGAKSFHLDFVGYGSSEGNPYFARFASSPGATVVTDALAQNPTFFSLWIGGNDVLGYALSGGDGTNPITPTATFNGVYNSIISKMTAGGRKGVIANLPYVTKLPHFTTIPYNPLTSSLLGQGNVAVGNATITALNAQLYGPLKEALTAFGAGSRLNLLSTTGGNPLLIKDESLTNLATQLTAAFTPTLGASTAAAYGAIFGQARQATATDLVLLPTQSVISSAPTALTSGLGFAPTAPLDKFGITYPLQDKHILIPTEITDLTTAADAYNVTIEAAATANDLAFVDFKEIMNQLSTTGITANNYTINSSFVSGGAFSLDGFHPTPRGYALIANEFIKAINSKYGSNLNGVNLGNYRILFPRDPANF